MSEQNNEVRNYALDVPEPILSITVPEGAELLSVGELNDHPVLFVFLNMDNDQTDHYEITIVESNQTFVLTDGASYFGSVGLKHYFIRGI